jgi:uncharacterized protein (DUF1786 family)
MAPLGRAPAAVASLDDFITYLLQINAGSGHTQTFIVNETTIMRMQRINIAEKATIPDEL